MSNQLKSQHKGKLRRRECHVLCFTGAGHSLTHMFMILFAPLLGVMADDLELSISVMAFYVTVANFCYGVGAIPAGWLGDRLGDKPLLVVFFAGCGLGSLMVGVSQSVWLLAVGVVILGLAASIYHPVGIAMISKSVATRGWALGINGIFGSVGTAAGPVFASLVAAWTGSWRWAFISLAIPSFLCAVWLYRSSVFDQPIEDRNAEVPAAGQSITGKAYLWLFVFLLAAMTCGGVFYHMILTMLPRQLVVGGWPNADDNSMLGGILAGVVLIFGAVGQYVAGHLADRYDGRWLYVGSLVLIIPFVYLIAVATGYVLLAIACVGAFFMFSIQPIENTLIATYAPRSWLGVVFGAKFVFVFGVGGTGSWLSGLLVDGPGLSSVFQVAAVFVTIAALCAFIASQVSIARCEHSSA